EVVVERSIARIIRTGKKERVAIGGRLHDGLRANIVAAARPVFDNKRLAETLRQPLTHQARKNVVPSAGSNRNNPAHRPCRIDLRRSEARCSRQRGGAGCQMQKFAAGKLHCGLLGQLCIAGYYCIARTGRASPSRNARSRHGVPARGRHQSACEQPERTEGVEPSSSPWTGDALPLSYIRDERSKITMEALIVA